MKKYVLPLAIILSCAAVSFTPVHAAEDTQRLQREIFELENELSLNELKLKWWQEDGIPDDDSFVETMQQRNAQIEHKMLPERQELVRKLLEEKKATPWWRSFFF